jgi:hypothetical protein
MALEFQHFINCFILFYFSCPPRTFLPALCNIFLDDTAPDNVLEVTARAITYYLDVSAECTRRIVAVDGAVKALCNRLMVADMNSRTSKDLAEQCIKVGLHSMIWMPSKTSILIHCFCAVDCQIMFLCLIHLIAQNIIEEMVELEESSHLV